MTNDQGLFTLFDGWHLAPEGAAVRVADRLAVIADLHLGYEWARGGKGDQIPEHSLEDAIVRLERLLERVAIDRLIVAGDIVESARPCARTAADLSSIAQLLQDRGVELVLLPGNHDPKPRPGAARSLEIAGWTIAHGHEKIAADKQITGHDHPILKVAGATTRCFLAGPRSIILPAFSSNAAGMNVAGGYLPQHWRDRELRCLAEVGNELLDFGPIESLQERMQANQKNQTPSRNTRPAKSRRY